MTGMHELRSSPKTGLDLYPTLPSVTRALIPHLQAMGYDRFTKVWEPTTGLGSMADPLKEAFDDVQCTDIYDYGYEHLDAKSDFHAVFESDRELIVCNPPYNDATNFVLKALQFESVTTACFLLRTNFLEGSARYEELFKEQPPAYIYSFSHRVPFRKNRVSLKESGVQAISWWVWRKDDIFPDPRVRWIHEPLATWTLPGDDRYVWTPREAESKLLVEEDE